jgi:hypothetical protein
MFFYIFIFDKGIQNELPICTQHATPTYFNER